MHEPGLCQPDEDQRYNVKQDSGQVNGSHFHGAIRENIRTIIGEPYAERFSRNGE